MRAAVLFAVVVLAAGCGASPRRAAPQSAASPQPQRSYVDCLVYERGTALSVEISGPGDEGDCLSIMRKWSGPDAFWTQSDDYDGFSGDRRSVCELGRGQVDVVVRDAGAMSLGTSMCGSFVHRGFTDVNGAP